MAGAPDEGMSRLPITEMAPLLRNTLAACIPELQRCCSDPWTVIGSAAAWLAGARVEVADLDVLTSERDARSLIGQWQARLLVADKLEDADRFRSRFARFTFPFPVEIMGGLEVATPGGWRPVRIDDVRVVEVDGLGVPIPAVDEQIRWLECFGRPKDLLRAKILGNLQGALA